jgi:hypothetical protein
MTPPYKEMDPVFPFWVSAVSKENFTLKGAGKCLRLS